MLSPAPPGHRHKVLLLSLLSQVEDIWYEVQDLRVTEVLPQMVALSETYMQVYELRQGSSSGEEAAAGQQQAAAG